MTIHFANYALEVDDIIKFFPKEVQDEIIRHAWSYLLSHIKVEEFLR